MSVVILLTFDHIYNRKKDLSIGTRLQAPSFANYFCLPPSMPDFSLAARRAARPLVIYYLLRLTLLVTAPSQRHTQGLKVPTRFILEQVGA